MPRTSRAPRRREPELQDANTPTAVLDHPIGDGGEVFTPFDQDIPLFRAIQLMSDADWERCMLYLYRLDPKVRNPEGSRKYIDVMSRPITEADVKESHGGGKYQIYLRDDSQRPPLARSHVFEIDGLAKFLPGQTVPQPAGASVAASSTVLPPAPAGSQGSSDTAEVVREVLRAMKQTDPGAQTTIETMTRATAAAIEIVKTASVREAGSTTGNPLLDKLIEKLFDNSLHGQEVKKDSRIDRLYDLAVERLLSPQMPEQKDPLQQLGFVKDLLGVENIGDLFAAVKGGGGADWKMEAFKLVGGLATNLPALLSFFSQQGELNFRRQLAIIEARRNGGGPIAPRGLSAPPNNVVPMPAPAAPAAPSASAPIGEVPTIDVTQLALTDIVVAFDNGLDGTVTAKMLRDKYPQLVEQLKPLAASEQNVMLFAKNTPPLSQIAGEEEFPAFLKEFCAEVVSPQPDDSADAS